MQDLPAAGAAQLMWLRQALEQKPFGYMIFLHKKWQLRYHQLELLKAAEIRLPNAQMVTFM